MSGVIRPQLTPILWRWKGRKEGPQLIQEFSLSQKQQCLLLPSVSQTSVTVGNCFNWNQFYPGSTGSGMFQVQSPDLDLSANVIIISLVCIHLQGSTCHSIGIELYGLAKADDNTGNIFT